MPSALSFGVLLLALVAGTFLGGILPLAGRWTRDNLSLLLAFGAGVLLAVIFLQMIPAVVELSGRWGGLAVLAGFILTSLVEARLHSHRHSGGHDGGAAVGAGTVPAPARQMRGVSVVAWGLGLHSLMDGLALGTGMELATLAPSLAFAILLHKAPDAFALSMVLLGAGVSSRRILTIQAFYSLATPIGALLALAVVRQVPPAVLGLAVAGASGTLLAVATEDLLPEVHRRARAGLVGSVLALVAGIAMVVVYGTLLNGSGI
ncbi:MAG: ZIP family metal transporter [Acidobacteriota bacterium]